MFEKIIIPFDFSDDSYYTVSCLKNIPNIREIILLHVMRSPYLINTPERVHPESDYARLRLEEVKKSIYLPRSKVKILVGEVPGGDIPTAIMTVAKEETPSLIMMGRRGKGVIESILLGSTASDLLTYGDSDILLLHPPDTEKEEHNRWNYTCPNLFSHIMICIDFSEPDLGIFCYNELPIGKQVTLFHVVTKGDSQEEVQSLCESAKEKMDLIAQGFVQKDISVQYKVMIGDPTTEILGFSEREDVSLILLKASGRRGIKERILGSTADNVARNTKNPVYIRKMSI